MADGPSGGGEPRPVRGKRILLIDDDRDVQRFVSGVLALEGAHFSGEATGEEGLARLRSSDRFDLVLLDLSLPGMSGWDVLSAYTMGVGAPGHAPVVIFTGEFGVALERSMEMGAAGHILKPVGARELVERIDSFLS